MLFLILGPSSLPVVVAQPDERHINVPKPCPQKVHTGLPLNVDVFYEQPLMLSIDTQYSILENIRRETHTQILIQGSHYTYKQRKPKN